MRAVADSAAEMAAYQRERAGVARQLAVPTLSDEGRARLVVRLAAIDAELAALGHVAAPQEGPQRTAEDPAPRRARRRP
jgi:hypothetical protein